LGSLLTHALLVFSVVYLFGGGGQSGRSTKIEIEFIGSSNANFSIQTAVAAASHLVAPVSKADQKADKKTGKDDIIIPASRLQAVRPKSKLSQSQSKASRPVRAPEVKPSVAPPVSSPVASRDSTRADTHMISQRDELDRMEESLFQKELQEARNLVARSAPAFDELDFEDDFLKEANAEAQLAAARLAEARLAAENAALEKQVRQGGAGGSFGLGVDDQDLPIGQALQQARNIDQLRQMPGNPRPQYSEEERFQRMQGEVLLLGFVTRSGQLTQLRILRATGFPSLDQKTLRAVSKWKFYPGQEGWVKIPVIWSLDGDPAGRGGRLRTQISQN
jgi:TonB family protein